MGDPSTWRRARARDQGAPQPRRSSGSRGARPVGVAPRRAHGGGARRGRGDRARGGGQAPARSDRRDEGAERTRHRPSAREAAGRALRARSRRPAVSALRIGTRRSDLALAQAGQVRLLLQAKGIDAQIVAMTTAGDEGQPVDVTTSPAGLKGLFIDTIVSALRDGEIDLAVHSAKDLPAEDEDDLVIGAVPERADPRDVLILRGDRALAAGMWVGTSSVRRRAQLLAAYPGVEVAHLRGNVPTRLRKLVASPDGSQLLRAAADASLPERAAGLVADALVEQGADAILASVQGT